MKISETGYTQVARTLKTLEPKIGNKIVRKAQREALKICKAALAALVPVASGKLRRTVRVRASKGPRGSRRTVSLALLVGEAGRKGDKSAGIRRTFYAFMQNYGWHTGKRVKKAGKVVGYTPLRKGGTVHFVPGKKFAQRALKSTEKPIRSTFERLVKSGVEQELSR